MNDNMKQIEVLANIIGDVIPIRSPYGNLDDLISEKYVLGKQIAEQLYLVGYRKQSETAKAILDIMEEDIKAAMKSNRNVMAARGRIDDVWNACSGKIDACLVILQKLKEVVAQFGVEVRE